jgi:hypothetical protein
MGEVVCRLQRHRLPGAGRCNTRSGRRRPAEWPPANKVCRCSLVRKKHSPRAVGVRNPRHMPARSEIGDDTPLRLAHVEPGIPAIADHDVAGAHLTGLKSDGCRCTRKPVSVEGPPAAVPAWPRWRRRSHASQTITVFADDDLRRTAGKRHGEGERRSRRQSVGGTARELLPTAGLPGSKE